MLTAQLLSGSFMDYALPRASDLPDLDMVLIEDQPTRSNPLGMQGSGQTGAIAAPQTITNGGADAPSALGVGHVDMPATPEAIWRLMQDASAE